MPELAEVLPKYLQVAKFYRDQIMSGSLAAGDEMPSERQLASEWGVSRPTATKAVAELRQQGLVESRQGSGTYVSALVHLNRRARDRYLRSRQAGRIYGPGERAEIVRAGIATAPEWVTAVLNGAPRAVRRHRIILTDELPCEISTSWFSEDLAERGPSLLSTTRIRAGTLAYVEEITGHRATHARDQLSARLATAVERKELCLSGRVSAVMVLRHVVFDERGALLECVEAVYPPDRWSFEQEYPLS